MLQSVNKFQLASHRNERCSFFHHQLLLNAFDLPKGRLLPQFTDTNAHSVHLIIRGTESTADRQGSITLFSFIAFLSDRTFKIYRGDSAKVVFIFPTHHPCFLFFFGVLSSGSAITGPTVPNRRAKLQSSGVCSIDRRSLAHSTAADFREGIFPPW
jgi:hypothetical protein